MKTQLMRRASGLLLGAAIAAASGSASAYTLVDDNGTELNFDVEAIFGAFYSEESYAQLRDSEGDVSWQEAYVKFGLSGNRQLGNGSSLFGSVNLLTSASFGDGDAAGFTTGDESDTELEDAFVGWRNELVELSFGRQNITMGDGFLLNGDSLNFGEGFDFIPGAPKIDRGGAYWLAARKAFDKTAMLRIGGEQGLRSDIFWMESDNAAQSSMELAGLNVEHVGEIGTFGAMYLEGLDVDAEEAAFFGQTHRDGQQTLSLRYQGNAGVENLFLSGEFVTQDQGDNSRKDGDGWYLEGGWTFADMPWTPSVNYRYSSFDEGFDPLFFGFNRGYGTWFQGEVAANYAGPFNSDTDVHHLGVKVSPLANLSLGALYFDFSGNSGDALDGRELDLYAEWVVSDNLIISPLVGFYNPDRSAADGGVQIGNDDTSLYAQVLAIVLF
ncbi:alginate export family protein [Marinobacterium arenosum]|uniref:alginate export family protein n=1 Tax=Marinobacterium arenosum TaxID=2862496 RepID=UPI001C94E69C|nr:alginate export family protein [Marinobacterium arenosum]MBY4678743.1 alginate export family protein [Marinobacterium arenosum]